MITNNLPLISFLSKVPAPSEGLSMEIAFLASFVVVGVALALLLIVCTGGLNPDRDE